jgi:hypothetical protein
LFQGAVPGFNELTWLNLRRQLAKSKNALNTDKGLETTGFHKEKK